MTEKIHCKNRCRLRSILSTWCSLMLAMNTRRKRRKKIKMMMTTNREKKKTCFYDQINSDSDHSKKPGLKRKLWV